MTPKKTPTGCKKCDYTGFAYGKIPCECSVPKDRKKGEYHRWIDDTVREIRGKE
jgi:hypothetical protein